MKQKIIKLLFLFLTVGVLTSSRENKDTNKTNRALNKENACLLQAADAYTANMTCAKTTVVKEKRVDDKIIPVFDNQVSLSPISRFILLQ